ncbi:hypothetical protein BLNAU_11520 [Blattamonas nauphoetae]|uniref:Uncharacterized protein n=1 Tax=Blattamonas nauphoetae TaxID=2049346 RepID=A0ABQ9XQM0_9EUKA|nr:hypothetical protein BLNAU_11520 [Blattamonas nauphoetae]
MSEQKVKPLSQQKLCTELVKTVNEYTQIFQALSNTDVSKEVLRVAANLSSEEKVVDETAQFVQAISKNISMLNQTLETTHQAIKGKPREGTRDQASIQPKDDEDDDDDED